MADRVIKVKSVVEIEWLVDVQDYDALPTRAEHEKHMKEEIHRWVDADNVDIKEFEIEKLGG